MGGLQLILVERVSDDTPCPCTITVLRKGRPHKYIMRTPTGKAKPKWRYYYRVPGKGVARSATLKRGSKFSGRAGDSEGHWEVLSDDDTHVFVKHSGTGKHTRHTKADFAKLVNEQHKEARLKRQGKMRGEILRALRLLREGKGGKGQAKRVRRLVDQAAKHGWIGTKETKLLHTRVDTAESGKGKADVSPERAALEAALKHVPAEHRAALQAVIARSYEQAPAGPKGKTGTGLGVAGSAAEVYVAGDDGKPVAQPAKYRVVDAEELIPSHDHRKGFAVRKDYPEGVQEREYHRSKSAQLAVREHASGLKPQFLITDNPDAAHGPPIVTPGGVVLGGNSRTMTMQLVYDDESVRDNAKSADAYREHLKKRAASYGLSAADIDAIKRPVLVREVAEPTTKNEARELVRRYNESFTRAMDPRAEQVSRAQKVGPKTLGAIADGLGETPEGEALDETWDGYLRSSRSKGLRDALLAEGVLDIRNVDKYVDRKTQRFNEDGRTLVTRLVLGKLIPDTAVLEALRPRTRGRLAAMLPYVIKAGQASPDYNLSTAVRTVAGVLKEMHDRKARLPSAVLKNRELGGGDHPVYKDMLSQALLAALLKKDGRSLGPGIRKYAQLAAAAAPDPNASLFGPKPPGKKATDAIKEAFGIGDAPLAEVEADLRDSKKTATAA